MPGRHARYPSTINSFALIAATGYDASQPATVVGDAHGFGAGTGAGLADGAGQVVAYGSLGQYEGLGEVGNGATGAGLA